MGVHRTETCLVVWNKSSSQPEPQAVFIAQPATNLLSDQKPEFTSLFGADAFYDAGSQGCGDGPLNKIAGLMRKLQPGQTLEVRATDPAVNVDLPAWCRMTGHILLEHQQDHYLIKRKE